MARPNRDKLLEQMQRNEQQFQQREAQLIQDMKDKGLNKYWVTREFDQKALLASQDIFKVGAGGPQNIPMPFPDKYFEKFRAMPKKRIGEPIMINSGSKLVHGTYLEGRDCGRPVIFAFSIAKNKNTKFADQDFNIKLDMLVAGKEWLPLVRFDGCDMPHPNYIVNGKVVKDVDHIERTSTSHIHLNNNATQVLTTDLAYTTATKAPAFITDKIKSGDRQDFFKAALDYTLSICGMSREMLANKNTEYYIDFQNYLFSLGN